MSGIGGCISQTGEIPVYQILGEKCRCVERQFNWWRRGAEQAIEQTAWCGANGRQRHLNLAVRRDQLFLSKVRWIEQDRSAPGGPSADRERSERHLWPSRIGNGIVPAAKICGVNRVGAIEAHGLAGCAV